MKIHRNEKSKGPSAVRCAGFPRFSTKGLSTGPLPKHTRQRIERVTFETRELARWSAYAGRSRRDAVGPRPRGGAGSHRALRRWKARAEAWRVANGPRVTDLF